MKKLFLTLICLGILSISSAHANPPQSTPALIAHGKEIYKINCSSCHGDQGDGNGPAGTYLNPKPRNFMKDKFKTGNSPEAIFKVITEGLKEKGPTMVGFGHLPENDRWALTYYVLSLTSQKTDTKKSK